MNKNKILLKRIESFCCDIFKSQDIEIEKLKGGINNQVFKCFKEKRCVVVKTYPTSAMGEKFTAEKEFLKLAGSVAREWVPKLIHADSQYKFLVMEYVYGSRYTKPPIVEDVKAAISFYLKINADESIARKLLKVQARDGFLSVSEHIKLIEDRISQFNTGHLPYKYSLELKNILELTKSKWSYIRDKNLNLLNEKPDLDAIEKKYLKVSPGDFGFHNVIKTSKGLRFIDFEYAGWDDPTKTIVDFFLQPKFPIKKKLVSEVINLIQKIINKEIFFKRVTIMEEVLRFKWISIILSILNTDRFRQLNDNLDDIEDVIKYRILTYHTFTKQEKIFDLY